ncbi:MAG TPA: MFS transporter [Pseudonocardiaceae bacterium]
MTERAARYRDVFAVPEFRALFGAQLLSVVGDQFARVALAVLVYDKTGSATLTALTYALTFLPSIVAGPLLSGLADRFPRRRVMVGTDLARAGLVALMAVPGTPFVVLCVLLVAVQMLAAPFEAARSSLMPLVFGSSDTHRDERYPVANAISNITYQGGQLLGFAPAGLLIAGVSTSGALLIDAATFVVSALFLWFGVRERPAAFVGTPGLRGWAARVSAGGRLVWANRRLRWLTLVLCVPMFPVVVEGLAVPYAHDLDIGTAAVGLLFAAEPAGSMIGLILISRVPHARQVRLMGLLAALSCGALVGCAARPGLLLTVLLWFVSGLASAYFTTANTELTLTTPDARRGQVNGLVGTAVRATQGLGVVIAGVTADLVHPAYAIAAAGAVGALYAWVAVAGWSRAAGDRSGAATAADDDDRPTRGAA